MKHNVIGTYGDENVLIPVTAVSGTTPIVSRIKDLQSMDGLSAQLITTGTVAGTWLVEVSNNYSPAGTAQLLQRAYAGDWSTITNASFSPAIAAVISGGTSQPVQMAPFMWRWARFTFTPSSGA